MEVIEKVSLVTMKMDTLAASLYEPEMLREIETARPGYLLEDTHPVRRHYVVTVRRVSQYTEQLGDTTKMFDQVKPRHEWVAEVEVGGETWRIPGDVLTRIIRMRDALISEARSAASREAAEYRKAGKALTPAARDFSADPDDYDYDSADADDFSC